MDEWVQSELYLGVKLKNHETRTYIVFFNYFFVDSYLVNNFALQNTNFKLKYYM